ncbi:dihydropteroate synthase [Polynucleobacter sp. MWH-Spelu-300-X4]|uniref:dihydropteroate synthase n=1 Tax=Polynucleobacter sp. MWH-Spelu-300-X4 TaxID=2689109 RepID=UPI001BFDBBEB|nr:dihydropteroate synthase [Polynucleobacter sp. MWH-Spelu-300-X4]QWD79275.1 dihydropteroate synthase [Polynucleobacter sp. MWH-Spelu-300-X4]
MSEKQITPVAWSCGRFLFDWSQRTAPVVMGILNLTPDSFSDGGSFTRRDEALRHAERMMAQGAEMIDVGGESSRPGSEPLSLQEELDRVMPILEALKDAPVAISLDTYKAKVMKAAVELGIDCINDIWAFRQPHAIEAIAKSSCGVMLMHMQKDPQTMQFDPHYKDVVSEVNGFLMERCVTLEDEGITRERLAIDPGFGFGKTVQHNMAMLAHFKTFCQHGLPVVAGISRKSSLGAVTGRDVEHRITASVAAALMAIERGAKIVRVHDVAETMDAVKIWSATQDSL